MLATITRPAKSVARTIPGVEAPVSSNTVILENIELTEFIDGQLEAKRDGASNISITGVSKFWGPLTYSVFPGDLINNIYKVIAAVPRRRRTYILAERLS